MKRLLTILLLALSCPIMMQAKADKQTVVFYVYLHCDACVDKVMKNIAFEKGVKDIVCSIEDQTVTVTYDAAKTDIPTLQKAFAFLTIVSGALMTYFCTKKGCLFNVSKQCRVKSF